MRIGIYTFHCSVICKTRQDDIRVGCEGCYAVSNRRTILNQPFRGFAPTVVGHELVTARQQAPGNATAHVADTNKTKSSCFNVERVHFPSRSVAFLSQPQ